MCKSYYLWIAAVLVSLVSTFQLRAAETAVSGEIVGVVFVDPGEFSMSNGGIVIIRSQVTDELLTGDLAGTMRVTSTLIANVNTLEGILFGTIDWRDPSGDGGFSGPFLGELTQAFPPGLGFDGHWSLHGYGSHQGETAHIDNFGPFSLPQVYEGVIRSGP